MGIKQCNAVQCSAVQYSTVQSLTLLTGGAVHSSTDLTPFNARVSKCEMERAQEVEERGANAGESWWVHVTEEQRSESGSDYDRRV